MLKEGCAVAWGLCGPSGKQDIKRPQLRPRADVHAVVLYSTFSHSAPLSASRKNTLKKRDVHDRLSNHAGMSLCTMQISGSSTGKLTGECKDKGGFTRDNGAVFVFGGNPYRVEQWVFALRLRDWRVMMKKGLVGRR